MMVEERRNRLLEFVVEAHDNFGLVGQGMYQRFFIVTQDNTVVIGGIQCFMPVQRKRVCLFDSFCQVV